MHYEKFYRLAACAPVVVPIVAMVLFLGVPSALDIIIDLDALPGPV